MMKIQTKRSKKQQDKGTRAIHRVLLSLFPAVPATIDEVVYRYNPVAIRILLVDPRFEGMPLSKRIDFVLNSLRKQLPESLTNTISMLVLRTQDEMNDDRDHDLIRMEFEDPDRSDN